MTGEEILKLAESLDISPDTYHGWLDADDVERFFRIAYAAGAAAEREACARLCDARYMGDNNREDMEARRCADAIRARGEK
jgi:hypothetical protein